MNVIAKYKDFQIMTYARDFWGSIKKHESAFMSLKGVVENRLLSQNPIKKCKILALKKRCSDMVSKRRSSGLEKSSLRKCWLSLNLTSYIKWKERTGDDGNSPGQSRHRIEQKNGWSAWRVLYIMKQEKKAGPDYVRPGCRIHSFNLYLNFSWVLQKHVKQKPEMKYSYMNIFVFWKCLFGECIGKSMPSKRNPNGCRGINWEHMAGSWWKRMVSLNCSGGHVNGKKNRHTKSYVRGQIIRTKGKIQYREMMERNMLYLISGFHGLWNFVRWSFFSSILLLLLSPELWFT